MQAELYRSKTWRAQASTNVMILSSPFSAARVLADASFPDLFNELKTRRLSRSFCQWNGVLLFIDILIYPNRSKQIKKTHGACGTCGCCTARSRFYNGVFSKDTEQNSSFFTDSADLCHRYQYLQGCFLIPWGQGECLFRPWWGDPLQTVPSLFLFLTYSKWRDRIHDMENSPAFRYSGFVMERTKQSEEQKNRASHTNHWDHNDIVHVLWVNPELQSFSQRQAACLTLVLWSTIAICCTSTSSVCK